MELRFFLVIVFFHNVFRYGIIKHRNKKKSSKSNESYFDDNDNIITCLISVTMSSFADTFDKEICC